MVNWFEIETFKVLKARVEPATAGIGARRAARRAITVNVRSGGKVVDNTSVDNVKEELRSPAAFVDAVH